VSGLAIVCETPAKRAGRKEIGNADCFLAPAALFSPPMRLVVFGNVIFAAHRRPPNLQKGWNIKFSN
jgi:hypothetical protein